jgi:hypothetical protein
VDIFVAKGANMFSGKKQTEIEFLREMVKDLQAQIIVLSGKEREYINTKIVQASAPLNGKPEVIKEPTEDELKEAKIAARDFALLLGGQAG